MSLLSGCRPKAELKTAAPSRDFQAAEYYDYYGVRDSAFYFYNRVVSNSHDSLEKGTAYFKMGLRQLEAGDYYLSQESLLSSIKALDTNNAAHRSNISADYNTLANATLELKDYESAIRNYRLASRFAPEGDPQLYILNNLGVAYQKQGAYQKAIAIFDSASVTPTSDSSLSAKLISNTARTKWFADPRFNPVPAMITALNLRKLIKDSAGINASYAHLSDYYTGTRPDSALYFARLRFDIAQSLGEAGNRLEALNQLAKVSPPNESKSLLEQYTVLDDSLSNVRSKDRNQYALIRYDAQQAKLDNLILQGHITTQRLIIWGTILFAALAIIALALRARSKRKRMKEAAENSLREQKLQTSKKVHDVVANGLYRVMNELEHREVIDKEHLLDQIEDLYEKSRDISYETESLNNEAFDEEIKRLLNAFENSHTKIESIGNQQSVWANVNASQQHELYLVLRELLVNMQKHSHAKKVIFHFSQQNEAIHVSYEDDGVGFPSELAYGNGLKNTVNRIKSINGQIIFDNSQQKGASILINFPLSPF